MPSNRVVPVRVMISRDEQAALSTAYGTPARGLRALLDTWMQDYADIVAREMEVAAALDRVKQALPPTVEEPVSTWQGERARIVDLERIDAGEEP